MKLKCIQPDEIEDSDLVAYIDGEALPATIAHIEACAFCQQEVNQLLRVDLLLREAAYRENCPEPDELWLYTNGMLYSEKVQTLSLHIEECRYCQQDVQQLGTAVFNYDSPAQPADASATSWLSSLRATGKEILQAIVQPPLQPGIVMRGEADESVVYRVGSFQVVLSKEAAAPAAESWQIEGQLINEEEPDALLNGTAIAWHGDEIVARTEVDEVGYFQFANLRSGQYNIYLELANILLSLPDLTIP